MKTALVLGGGGARGAYEAGVVAYLRDELEPELDRRLALDILVGTSVGAINACFLAATAHRTGQGEALLERWRSLRVNEILRFGPGDLFGLLRELLGRPQTNAIGRRTGLVDSVGLEESVLKHIPWRCIRSNIDAGLLQALCVSATHVGSGQPVVFVERRDERPLWPVYAGPRAVAARIGLKHALASAAIPLLFPAVSIKGRLYVDGGLRLSVPLSPALYLGAERVIVISSRHSAHPGSNVTDLLPDEELTYGTAPSLLGKALDALLLDRAEQDIERLQHANAIIAAGEDAYGSGFMSRVNARMPSEFAPLRHVREMLIRPSKDIGALAADFARSPEFQKRCSGLPRQLLKRLVERESEREADLVSYLLFDGAFADLLIELGKADARARHGEWLSFFADLEIADSARTT